MRREGGKQKSKFERVMEYRKKEEAKARANLKKIKQLQSPNRGNRSVLV